MAKTIDIFVKSYKRDFWLLQLSLKTLSKNATGYNNIILLIPEKEKHDFDTRNMPDRTLIHYVDEYGNGGLYQQWCKLNAHNYCYADYIMFSDSDNFFDHPLNVQDLISDGKPEILYTDYKQLPDAIIWKEPTEKFIKEPVQYEFMRRLPLLYHRSTLVAISEYAPDLEKTIMESGRFSEFNCLGAFAYKYERDKYNFVNTDNWTYVPPHSTQTWSHASKADGISEIHLREYIRLLETIMKSFDIPLP
jgi:hypothetical protein